MKYISTLTILLLLLVTACTKQGDIQVITNVNGYTLAGDSLLNFSTLAIQNGKVLDIGGDEISDKYSAVTKVDGKGQTMLPGLIDAHGHVMGLGFQELQVNVAGITTLEGTLEKIKEYAEENPDLEWIQGRGWNQTHWEENEFPTAADLDKVVPDRPVWLSRVDGHAGWANTLAMKKAGISRDTPDTQGGKIIRDSKGDAAGVFVDAAQWHINSIIPEATATERALAFEKSLEQMRKMGITSAHDAGVSVEAWELFKSVADKGKLTTRIYAMIGGAGKTFDELSKNGPINSYANDMLSLRSVKIYSDGALGSRGAAMLEPYSDDPGNVGLLFSDQDEMNEMVLKVTEKGFQANVHAIGDRANREVLNAFEYSRDKLGEKGLRNRVEHTQIVSLEDIPRFKELNIIASMQPTHATSDMNMAEDRVGPDRIKGSYAWKSFLNQGTVVAAGSDFPVEHSNPFYGLYSAVTRMDHEGNPPGGWYPNEALTREEALRAFTVDAAYAAHQENVLGTLEKGKWADFILIDKDYFKAPAIEIWDTKVLETWVAGKKVYSSN
ncbi:MAG: amidohydrolase [Balneolaceae bacterium]